MSVEQPTFVTSLICGAVAGTTVDVALFPLDTIKTRLQSSQGFLKSGGFNGIYKGLRITALGSAPGAALFFSSYDAIKHSLSSSGQYQPFVTHMVAASIAEIVSTIIVDYITYPSFYCKL